MHKLIGLALCATFAAGCGGTVMTCPRVETPVLLGPVDRIGATPHAVAGGERNLEAHAKLSLQVVHAAGGTYTSATRTPRSAGASPIWMARLERDEDVHVTTARASGFVWDALGAFWMNNEVNLDMTVTKAGAR